MLPNYQRKAQAPNTELIKKTVITDFKNCTIIGWVLVALDAKVRGLAYTYNNCCWLLSF